MRVHRNVVTGVTAALVAAVLPAALPLAASAAPGGKPDLKPAEATAVASQVKKGPVISLGKSTGAETYIVQLDSPAVPTRALAKRDPNAKVPTAATYRSQIRGEQADVQTRIKRITGSRLVVPFTYTNALNGFAIKLTRAQAAKVAQLPGIAAVTVDIERKPTTDVGPEWIGAPSVWDGTNVPGGVGSKGEGEVVGIIDTGINAANPSFAAHVPAAEGGDDYTVTNPRGKYYGACDPTNTQQYVADWGCNDKLIGYYNFLTPAAWEGHSYDYEGHGTHTASTVAGNQVSATTYSDKGGPNEFSVTRTIKGVAPHANIISYAACCEGSALAAAIDQAITDQVDVINYSIGASAPTGDPWSEIDAKGFLNARAAGINVAVSAGNDGPGAGTLGSPADVPWVTSVGATQHDRQWQAHVQGIAADGGATLPDIDGVGFSKATNGTVSLVDAADAGDQQCHKLDPAHPDAAHLDPALVAGKIVVCVRGGNGRVEKGRNVADLGGVGMILANDEASGTSLNADAHALPAVHITYADGVALRAWMKTVTNPVASLSGGVEHIGNDVADIMAAFSSRGPNRAWSLVGPSVSAPGVDILAAAGVDNQVDWEFMSGTSMASPHTAGALTLLDSVQPSWTPAERQSALMTTAYEGVKDSDGTPADWFDMGSGRIDLTKAAKAGFVLNETYADYVAANPASGGDLRTLNLASMADDDCLAECSWTRTLTGTSTGVGTWTVSVSSGSDQLTLKSGVDTVDLTDGGTANLDIHAQIAAGASTDTWLMGEVTLTPPAGSDAPVAHLPVAVLPTNGVLPKSIDINTRRDAGSQVTTGFKTVAASDLQAKPSGLVPGRTQQLSLVQDPTNGDAFDGLTSADGVHVEHLSVPSGAARLVAKLKNSTAPDLDMYVGTGEVTQANVFCQSATGTADESCDVANPPAGDVWVLVQDWDNGSGPTDTADLTTAVVAGDGHDLTVAAPSTVSNGEPYSLTTTFDEDALTPGQTWYGAITLGTGPDSATDIGVVPVNLTRAADDVTVTADKSDAKPGDVVTYTVDIASNVTPKDLDYDVTAQIPAGTTYVAGSATDGATFADGKVSLHAQLKSPFTNPGFYSWTTSDTDPHCVNPLSGEAGYVPLTSISPSITARSTITGDTKVFNTFSFGNFPFFEGTHKGVSFTDDGQLYLGGEGDTGAEPWTPQSLPDPNAPNGLFAPLWQDGEIFYDAATNSGVSLASDGSSIGIIEYNNLRTFHDEAATHGSLDMEAILQTGTSSVVFAYDDIHAGDGGQLQGVTIGVENNDGTRGSGLVNVGDASTVLHDGLVVCADFTQVAAPARFTYQVKVGNDPATLDNGPLATAVTSTTSDPAAKPVTVTDTVNLSGLTELSTTTLTVAPASISVGGSSVATATVTTTGPKPTGQVTFLVDGAQVGTGTIDDAGHAMATLSGVGVGSHAVTASYPGDGTTAPSTASPASLVVSPSTTEVSVRLNPASVRAGGSTVATATVTSAGSAVPTGTVEFSVDGHVKATVTLTGGGTASAKLTGLPSGDHSVIAQYLGDSVSQPATSAAAALRVAPKLTPRVTLQTPPSIRVHHRRTIDVSVQATGAVPTGQVRVIVRQGTRATAYTARLVDGRAVIRLERPSRIGHLTVTAVYGGDAAVASGSATARIRVRR